MSLTGFNAASKAKLRLRPSNIEGKFIKYNLSLRGCSLTKLAADIGVSIVTIRNVIFGSRRSVRIEIEIAKILGKDSWNDVVSEAREATKAFAEPPRSTPRGKRRSA